MEYFDIRGGDVMEGELIPSGNKNEALPVLAASLLCSGKVVLKNVPDIIDVNIMLEIMCTLGANVSKVSPNTIEIDSSNINFNPLDKDLCGKIRTSILFAGPLLARLGSIILPLPGGDVIGRRRLDTHFLGFEQLGALYSNVSDGYKIVTSGLKGADIFLDEASVTATENIIMAAVLAKGNSIIRNAASEPHVQGLCNFLVSMGAKITGVGTNVLFIEGVDDLHGTEHTIGPDYIEVGSFISLCAMTGGELTIKNVEPSSLVSILNTLKKIGIETETRGKDIFVPHHPRLVVRKEMNNSIPKIDDGPWPSFPSDMMSMAIVAATQADGTILFFEKMFESRLFFVDRLISMGAQIILCDPHRVVVSGASQLYGTKLDSPDIRAGMALVMAAVCAKGRSRIYNVGQIDRGYENLEEKLRKVGITIERNRT